MGKKNKGDQNLTVNNLRGCLVVDGLLGVQVQKDLSFQVELK
jgi:hypothetical protein